MAFNVGVGFLAASLVAPVTGPAATLTRRRHTADDGGHEVVAPTRETPVLDTLMKEDVK
jgi:hypothetical protein